MSILSIAEEKYLLEAMQKLLSEYDYNYTDKALREIIQTWAESKETLINAFKKHQNYIDGKFMIVFNHSYTRVMNTLQVYEFIKYIQWTVAEWCVRNNKLPDEIDNQRINDGLPKLPDKVWRLIDCFPDFCAEKTINEDAATQINNVIPKLRIHNGEKTSRVINKFCKYLNYDKHPDYNKEFAKLADALSPLTITQKLILSINPIDYLTMSFGNSWASCHTIDKDNKRRMPNSYSGSYSSGTVSYMLDETSMVLYAVDDKYDGVDYEIQPKINRQMFHWGQDKLIQSRLYPQSNDDDSGAYEPYRQVVQEIISQIFEFPNLWTLSRGSAAASKYITSEGTHYRDYARFDSCSLSRVKNTENHIIIKVGSAPICIECGCRHDITETINCCSGTTHICTKCGRLIHDDDTTWVGDDPYCENCVAYCEICDQPEVIDNVQYVEGYGYVCNYCWENEFVTCEDCGRVVLDNESAYIEERDRYLCEDCAKEKYECCENCGTWHPKGSLNERGMCDNCVKRKERIDEVLF